MRIKAIELGFEHLGRTVTVDDGETTVTGILSGVEHNSEMIYELWISGQENWYRGRTHTKITVMPNLTLSFSARSEKTVEVSE